MIILVPMVGINKTFKNSQYTFTKGLIEIKRKTIIEYVYECVKGIDNSKVIFIVRKEDILKYHMEQMLKLLAPNCEVVTVVGETAGAACSCLLAINYINNEEELLIYNGDQVVDYDLQEVVNEYRNSNYDGGILTFHSVHPRWSYVRVDGEQNVVETAEKRPISNLATAGTYYFKKGEYFVRSTKRMIEKGASKDGLYYVCPAYNELILEQKKIGYYIMDSYRYFSLSVPKDIEIFEKHIIGGKKYDYL